MSELVNYPSGDWVAPEAKTKLLIEKDEVIFGTNTDSGQSFELRNMSLGRRRIDGKFSYYGLRDLSNTENVEILVRESDDVRKIGLPNNMLKRLAEYLANEKDLSDFNFDCSAFAHLLNEVPHEFEGFNSYLWNLEELDSEENLAIGDTILLSKILTQSASEPKHFAIYIGDGLYISKFGQSSRLIASTLEEMKKGFDADLAHKASPKPEYQDPSKVQMENYRKS